VAFQGPSRTLISVPIESVIMQVSFSDYCNLGPTMLVSEILQVGLSAENRLQPPLFHANFGVFGLD